MLTYYTRLSAVEKEPHRLHSFQLGLRIRTLGGARTRPEKFVSSSHARRFAAEATVPLTRDPQRYMFQFFSRRKVDSLGGESPHTHICILIINKITFLFIK